METSQLICMGNKLTGFYMIATFNELIATFAVYRCLLCLTENGQYLYQVLLKLHYCLPPGKIVLKSFFIYSRPIVRMTPASRCFIGIFISIPCFCFLI